MNSKIEIKEASSKSDYRIAADLFREYQAFLNVDLCFQGFEQELATLPGKYAPPNGAILLAYYNNEIAGCVAVRPTSEGICEMKRLYVKQACRGLAIGQKLTEKIVQKSSELGYQKMQLDTLARLESAIGLYKKFGFERIPAYYDNPLNEVVFMELGLN